MYIFYFENKMAGILSSLLVLTVLLTVTFAEDTTVPTDTDDNSTCSANDKARLAANKEMVMTFFQAATGDHDFDAIDKYISETKFIQHNPWTTDGRETLKTAFKRILGPLPKTKVEFHRSCAEGDLVWMHHKSKWQGEDAAFVDIYRVEDGKIVEHWDVIQKFPKSTENPHPLF